MVEGRLPDGGPVRLGPVTLPAGRLVTSNGVHVEWATADRVPASGQVWADLAGMWRSWVPPARDDDPEFTEVRAPFTGSGPGWRSAVSPAAPSGRRPCPSLEDAML